MPINVFRQLLESQKLNKSNTPYNYLIAGDVEHKIFRFLWRTGDVSRYVGKRRLIT
jgi:hypothetical protein